MAVESQMLPSRPGKVAPSSNAIQTDRKHSIPPPTSDRIDRTSFSSIKESNSGGAQSFTDSKTSSYLRNEYPRSNDEDAIDDSDSGSTTPVENNVVGMLNPQSTLHGLVCPCDGFKGWKSISVGGKIASRSFSDLSKLKMGWNWETKALTKQEKLELDETMGKAVLKVDEGRYPAGQSPIEKLPVELLGKLTFSFFEESPNVSDLESRHSRPLKLFGTAKRGGVSCHVT
jgi:hypothetical protein